MNRARLPRACPAIPFDVLLADSLLEHGAAFLADLLRPLPAWERAFWWSTPRIGAAIRARAALEHAQAAAAMREVLARC